MFGTTQEPANILLMSANFIYLWFVLYYNILEQLKLYNGPCSSYFRPIFFFLDPIPIAMLAKMVAVFLNDLAAVYGSLFGRIFRSFSDKCLFNDILTLAVL